MRLANRTMTWSAVGVVALSAGLQLLAPSDVESQAKAKPISTAKDHAAGSEVPKWDVARPPGATRSVVIDTAETTWSDVHVSPDGRTILFDMLGDLFTVPIEGGEARALTTGGAWDFQARFSPDGKQIVFVSDRGGGDNLWVMNVDGGGARALTEEKDNLVHNPSFSPDGQFIVAKKGFTSTRSIPAGEIWLFNLGGGGGLQLTERPLGPKDQKTMAEPAFSPDGRYVYYSQDVTPGARWEYNKDSTGQIFAIQRLDRQKAETITLTGGPGGAVRPTPSPDGARLAFVRRLPGLTSAIYVRELSSGLEWPLFTQLERDLQETNGDMGNAPSLAWTPDSQSIVFWSGGKFHRVSVAEREVATIPVHVRVEKSIQPAVRFPVEVSPDAFPVRLLRWAQYSPQGDRVVFQALGYLWVATPGEPARRLTTQTDHFEFWPSFSRDGRQIVFTSWDDEELGSVRVVSVAGGEARTVVAEPGLYVEPYFSPDGEAIVYRKLAGGYLLPPFGAVDPGIYLAPARGGESRRLTRAGEGAHFSADRDRVFFTMGVDETARALKSVDLQGLDERTHLQGAKVLEFRLSPDGRWVAFTEGWNAWVAPFTLTGRKVEIGAETKSIPVRQVSKRSGAYLHWSAASDRLHWSHGATLFSRELKDAFAHLAGAPEKLPDPVTTGLDLGFVAPSDRPDGMIALSGARVVTMRDARRGTAEVIDDGVVLIEGHRIRAVGRRGEVQIPSQARVLDCSGKTIVPGFIDVHAHGPMAQEQITPQQNWMQYSNLAFGVTTIHDPSNDTASIFAVSELQRAGATVAPRVFSTGTILYGAHAPDYTATVESLDDARFHVQRLKDVGAISVKSYQLPRRDQRQQIIAAGRELGIMVLPEGGAKFQHNMTEIVDGHTGIEHAIPLKQAYDDVIQLWAASEVGYTPTLGVAYGGLSGELYWYDRTEVWRNPRLMRYVPRFAVEPQAIRRAKAPDEHYNHIAVARFAKRLADRGVSVQVGAHGQREGLATHWEMWMLEQGGFSPWEALRAATIQGAWYLGLDGDLGSIEPGKLADLAVIDGNPLVDLGRSEYVSWVVLHGRVYDTATMDQIAPARVPRRPFYFEREGGDTIHPAAARWYQEQAERFGWRH